MSVTDGFREWFESKGWYGYRLTIEQMLDRIDAEYEEAIQQAMMGEGGVPATDENMAEHGWVRGPLDADGEMWRRGDMSDSNWGVIEGIAYEDGRWLISGHDISAPWVPADSIRHYHEPTIEDVLHELVGKAQALSCIDDEDELVTEYAKRLRLAEEGE